MWESIIDLRGKGAKEPTFPDKGCEHSVSCLSCPLDFCKHDVPFEAQLRYKRNSQIVEDFLAGVPIDQIAGKFRMIEKSIEQIVVSNPEDLLRSRLVCK